MEQYHVMIDIETYDTKPSAVILSIGACKILNPSDTLYMELSVHSQVDRSMSPETIQWWEGQENCPRNGSTPLYNALDILQDWLHKDGKVPIVWCKGTDFDTAILTNAYQGIWHPVPWKYNNVRDCRTVFKIAQYEARKANHNALTDAITQAEDLLGALNSLQGELA